MSTLPIQTSEIVKLLGLIPHPEGGFFLEVHRSGTEPMTTRGQTNFEDPKLIVTNDRQGRREDQRRNALTSIFWIPTTKSARLILAINKSDHVHYYQGGKPFVYIVYDPIQKSLKKITLGPDLAAGQKLQVCVPGGFWKCGYILADSEIPQEYTIIGEAVSPGFDMVDFHLSTEADLKELDSNIQDILRPYLHENLYKEEMDFDAHYNEDQMQKERTESRA